MFLQEGGKTRRKWKLNIMVGYPLERNVSKHSHWKLNNIVKAIEIGEEVLWRASSSPAHYVILYYQLSIWVGITIVRKNPMTSCMNPQDIEHEQQCYDSPGLLLKKNLFFFPSLTLFHPIKILQSLTKLFLELQYQICHFAGYFRNIEWMEYFRLCLPHRIL